MKGFTTKALHSKFSKKDVHGSLKIPVYESVAFESETAEDLASAFQGKKPAHTYSRITNPTVEYFEGQVKNLTNSFGVVAVSSGMAAITNLILTVASSGNNIVTTKNLFGNTYSLFERTLKPWGLNVKYTDLNNVNSVKDAIDNNTVAIYAETISNPGLEVVDIKALSKIAKQKNILLIVDTTVTPPYLFNSKEFGVDVEVLSSTKYISGGATSVGGLIIDNGTFNWGKIKKLEDESKKLGPFTLITKLKREVYRNLGACLTANNAYLQSLGLETLALRAQKSCANTLELAKFLENESKISTVNYPGLESSDVFKLTRRQFINGAGGILTFDLNTQEDCFEFINALKIIRRATNLNDNKTLIIHPASTIFSEFDKEKRTELGIRDTMIRLSVGIEDLEDLKFDIKQALEVL